eukprot:1092727-Prymnesium_polylepis.1
MASMSRSSPHIRRVDRSTLHTHRRSVECSSNRRLRVREHSGFAGSTHERTNTEHGNSCSRTQRFRGREPRTNAEREHISEQHSVATMLRGGGCPRVEPWLSALSALSGTVGPGNVSPRPETT